MFNFVKKMFNRIKSFFSNLFRKKKSSAAETVVQKKRKAPAKKSRRKVEPTADHQKVVNKMAECLAAKNSAAESNNYEFAGK